MRVSKDTEIVNNINFVDTEIYPHYFNLSNSFNYSSLLFIIFVLCDRRIGLGVSVPDYLTT